MAITGAGTYNDYAYTGGIQTFTVPITGLYGLEAWGAQGGPGYYGGSNGGYSNGYIKLNKGQVLYIVCGGAGTRSAYGQAVAGGYNGGGSTKSSVYNGYMIMPGSGGGATHIATRSGLLAALENYKSNVLLVAGGGGGSGDKGDYQGAGGTGGGTNGANGQGITAGTGGTQTAGGVNGYQTAYNGFFGRAANMDGFASGGGGWYGGAGGLANAGAGGGSGYIGGVPAITFSGITYTPNTSNGNNAGAGKARITLIKVQSNLKFNNTTAEKVIYNGKTVDKVVFNGTSVFG